MHVDPDVIPASQDSLTGVYPYADTKLFAPRPSKTREIPLNTNRGGNRIYGVRENAEKRIPLGVHHNPTVVPHLRLNNPRMLAERLGILLPQIMQQSSRTLNVTKQESDRSSRQFHHANLSNRNSRKATRHGRQT